MKKSIIYFSTLYISLLSMSCSDSFLDVNTDTNSPTLDVLSPDLVLPVAQYWTAETIHRNRFTNNLGNMMMYNWSQSDGFAWYNDEFLYNVTSSFYQQIWDRMYRDALKQYRVIQTFEAEEFSNYRAIGKIMESFEFQILVDLYGDIPYSEALKRGENPAPTYDNAQSVYENLIVVLDQAMQMIDNASTEALVPSVDDIIFGGDMQMWKKFANTIKLRILVRQSDISGRESYLQENFSGMNSVGFITSDVTVNPGYIVAANQQNPFWNAFGKDTAGSVTNNNDATCASDFILDFLENLNDTRIDFIYEKPSTGHLGVVQGLLDYDTPIVDQFIPANVSNIGPGILKSATMDAVIFTASENYFLQAEAMMKGFLQGDPKEAFQKGIQASFDYLGDPGANAYMMQPKALVNWDFSPNKMEAIITQKWIALNGIDAIQSWFDYSRTGFPLNLPVSLLATTTDRPVRLFYPASEVTSNSANLPQQRNAFTDKIFWAN